MSSEPDFVAIYAILGVRPEDGWDAVRRAYRKKAQATHPDKAQGIASVEKIAQSKFEQVNGAYKSLKHYYRLFGVLPPLDQPKSAAQTPRHAAAATPTPAAAPAPAPATNDIDRSPWPMRGATVLFVIVLAGVWLVPRQDKPDSKMAELNPARKPSSAEALIVPDMTIGELIETKGPPDSTAADVWTYGQGQVYIQAGKVVGWKNFPALPDHSIKRGNALPQARENPDRFTIGDSKTHVRKIQGDPIRQTEEQWFYGVSTVYFSNGKVSGWYESPANPLKSKPLPPNPKH